MKLSKEQLQMLRDISIASMLGLNIEREHKISCPCLGHNDSDPSFMIYKDNSYHCFGCSANGRGAIDFIRDVYKISNGDALQKLISMI